MIEALGIAAVIAAVAGAIWGLFKEGILGLLGIIGWIGLIALVIIGFFASIAYIFSSGLIWGIIVFVLIVWGIQAWLKK